MRLYKDIFKITEDNVNFLFYLYEHPQFTTDIICEKFKLNYPTFFKYLKIWVRQGFVIEERQPPALGEIKYRYSLSQKAIKKLDLLRQKLQLSEKN
ncbi:MAG: hypothetical protein ACFFDF_03990 [Candidatus Odinarchaeota archaeon]